jgi:hypothetical protein
MENTISTLNEISNQVFEISVKLEKAKAVFESLGHNSYLEKTTLEEKDRYMLSVNHDSNVNLYSVVNDYLYDAMVETNKLLDQVRILKNEEH